MEEPTLLFGLALSTYRDPSMGADAHSFFQFESAIAAISIWFFRSTISKSSEPTLLKAVFALLLAGLAYTKQPYELILAAELLSYAISFFLFPRKGRPSNNNHAQQSLSTRLAWIAISALVSISLSHIVISGKLLWLSSFVIPQFVIVGLEKLFPIQEIQAAYDIMKAFSDPDVLRKQTAHLLFVTFHIQAGMGYLGINFLRREQSRRNQLLRMDMYGDETDTATTSEDLGDDSQQQHPKKTVALTERATNFKRMAVPFILFSALPYMFQIILYGNINKFAFSCLQHDIHRTIRLNELFDHDSHLTAMANESPVSPEAYARSMNTVVNTVYEIFNRKIFSLPKILLLPTVMSKQPLLVAKVFPLIIGSDWIKATAVSYMTTKIEDLQKQTQDLQAVRSKVEAFDIKNAELLQRSGLGATQFTKKRWEEMTVKIQDRLILQDLISRSKDFFSFMQRNFVFSVLIDCALADLIALGKITAADTFVYSRAYEDAIDMLLMRSRGEAELARMMTEISKLRDLSEIWESSKARTVLPCRLAPVSQEKSVVVRNLHYSRGTAVARADHLELRPGVYALTGSNGSGKSTLFRILMSCSTNEKSIDLPVSINLLTPTRILAEEDDFLRESCCETENETEIDESTAKVSRELIVGVDGDVTESQLKDPSKPPSADLHPRMSITMPSSSVVEISQTFYWPLYSRPIDWIYHEHVLDKCSADELEIRARGIALQLQELEFFQKSVNETNGEGDDVVKRLVDELTAEKDDWFGDLSGGQKSKVELVRKVFLHEKCPDVLLIDETMAPLDPTSKSLVMSKLKTFCEESIIIVIYHTDVDKQVEGKQVNCVPSSDFFDKNIHLEKGVVILRDTC